jgi:hypothetical protein
LERSDNVADSDHAFAMLKRGYPRRLVIVQESEMHFLRYARAILCLVFRAAALTRRIGFSCENGPTPNVTYYVSFPLRNAEFQSEHIGATPGRLNVAALERSDNVADSDHAFAMLKRGYGRQPAGYAATLSRYSSAATPAAATLSRCSSAATPGG